jgi:two-component system phosphate regulon sensor histidine kinase PhoR
MKPALSLALLNSIPLPVIAVDGQGHLLGLNDAASRLLPPEATKPLGQRFDVLFPNMKVLLNGLKGDKATFRHEITLGENGVAEASVTPMPGRGWAITIYDVTEHKDVQARKNQLLGEVTHDLKSPLTAILSFTDLVRAAGELNDRQEQFLTRIRATASRMSEQVHQLLDVVWIESGMKLTLTEVDLLGLVKSTLAEVEPRAAAKHMKLVLDAPEGVPALTADGTRLSQVIANLLNNAVKYSDDGTTVTVKVWAEPEQVAVSVRDQGFGIPQEHLEQLFERFYRVRSQQTRQIEGTGLGLYIARSIVEQHGGQVAVESEPGVGSTFSAYLPLKRSAPGAAEAVSEVDSSRP